MLAGGVVMGRFKQRGSDSFGREFRMLWKGNSRRLRRERSVRVRRLCVVLRSLRSLLDTLWLASGRRPGPTTFTRTDWDSDGVSCTMCAGIHRGDSGRDVPLLLERFAMSQTIESRPMAPATSAPYSRALQLAAGVCLVLAAVTNGLSQYVGELVTGGGDFSEQIRWGGSSTSHSTAPSRSCWS